MPTDAKAFDSTDWVWTVNVDKDIVESVNVDVDIAPTGMATVENLQQNIGDVTSTATLNNFTNNPPALGEDGVVSIDETFTVTSNFPSPVGVGNSVNNIGGNVQGDGDSPLDLILESGTLSEQENAFTVINDVNVTGDIELSSIEGVNDAVDLPQVVNAATSVANNMSLDSTVALNVSNGQFNYGGFAVPSTLSDDEAVLVSAFESSDNSNHALANVGTLAGALGMITQGEVTADATIDGSLNENGVAIQNASVDNAATAVGNNFSVDLASITASDSFIVADTTQFNYANMSATALVDGVSVDNYTGFGNALDELSVQTPIISNVATAVGNNASITVSSPDLGL